MESGLELVHDGGGAHGLCGHTLPSPNFRWDRLINTGVCQMPLSPLAVDCRPQSCSRLLCYGPMPLAIGGQIGVAVLLPCRLYQTVRILHPGLQLQGLLGVGAQVFTQLLHVLE